WMFQRVNYGPVTAKNRDLPDLTPREWALMVPTIAMAVVMGVVPGFFMRPMEPSVTRVVERVTGQQPAQVRSSGGAARRLREALTGTLAVRDRAAIPAPSGASQP
ncbi:MAG TPA: hypothetical protein VE379_03655, partial [Vicinamibacterales bacterium]|nr:hypothetical protein [Vicinamibacterales bacterium]